MKLHSSTEDKKRWADRRRRDLKLRRKYGRLNDHRMRVLSAAGYEVRSQRKKSGGDGKDVLVARRGLFG
jgi:hypothetical protein